MSPDGPLVVSLYLDARWLDEHQRDRVRLFVENRSGELRAAYRKRPHEDEIAHALDWLERRAVNDLVSQANPEDVDSDGFAFFVSPGRNLYSVVRSRTRFENEMEVEEQPRVLQLAHLLDHHSPAFVVLVDGRWMRIFEVALGGVVVEAEIEQYLPDRVDSGDRGPFAKRFQAAKGPAALARGEGMSQMRHQRHIRDHLEHNLKTAASVLTRLAVLETDPDIVLCGEPELRAVFRREMPSALRSRITHEMRMDSKAPRHHVVGAAAKALLGRTDRSRSLEVDGVIGEALGGGLSVLGTEDTLLALQESRLYSLYLDLGASIGSGWRCEQCDVLGRKAELSCPFCRGGTTTVDLAQEVARRAISKGTRVVTVRDHVRLRHFRGMAGTLRHGISPITGGVGYAGHEPLPPT